jgi:hypothetical protein
MLRASARSRVLNARSSSAGAKIGPAWSGAATPNMRGGFGLSRGGSAHRAKRSALGFPRNAGLRIAPLRFTVPAILGRNARRTP